MFPGSYSFALWEVVDQTVEADAVVLAEEIVKAEEFGIKPGSTAV
jgi:hypothetical protein